MGSTKSVLGRIFVCGLSTVFLPVPQAFAVCVVGPPGTETCDEGPQSFTNPPISTLIFSGLSSNIVSSGVAGAELTSTFPKAPDGISLPGHGLTGPDGTDASAVTIQLAGPNPTFLIDATNGIGINAQSIGGEGGNGGIGIGTLLLPGIGGDGGPGGNAGDVTVTTSGTGRIITSGFDRHGILGLSKGGAGGNGGDGLTFLSVLGVGGSGGTGGSPGNVTISNTLDISTSGNGAAGIWGQSIGAGGGSGGSADGLGLINIGGQGAAASSGGSVTVSSSGTISTVGRTAHGIFAQSVGGYSGSGGGSFGLFSFGGNPTSGGNGGIVNVDTFARGSITTTGVGSYAIFAQSVGGGGGAGGTGPGLIGFGGAGGSGGNGQAVTVRNRIALTTTANGSSALVAQSIGGGGGSGGTGAGLGAIGGNGGGAGNGGTVRVENHNSVIVSGNGDGFELGNYGIFAQSVGGGGGSANISGGIVAIGGKAGGGGNGGEVFVSNDNTVISSFVDGLEAGAIYAQSVGGGGGRGGTTIGLFSIGGSGGAGGTSGSVTVNNTGELTTSSRFSRGIFAQSIGGGGGDGGFAGGVFTGGGSGGEGGSVANPLRIGGKGNDTRNNNFGGSVTVNNSANITTHGDDSQGIFAQSVGGGGGNGGGTVSVGAFLAVAIGGTGGVGGNGGAVNVGAAGTPHMSLISTSGERSAGIFAQSVGGGGGNGGFAVAASGGVFGGLTVALGGNGASGGSGGVVTVTGTDGSITTRGSFSSGIYAESLGGGGGSGGFSVAGGLTVNGVQLTIALGGQGGAGGAGGNVTVQNFADITTGGVGLISEESHAIFASSVGGGGGSGGFSVGAAAGQYGAVGLSFGGNGATGNSAGFVNVENTASLQTYGAQSHGILAQSIGGGGGSGGFGVAAEVLFGSTGGGLGLSMGGNGGDGGNGGVVFVTNDGNINTHGQRSYGILAQSIGGGGGNGGFTGAISLNTTGITGTFAFGGKAGPGTEANDVIVHHTGVIQTFGDNSTGIFAQSVGGGGGDGGFSLSANGSLKGNANVFSLGGQGGAGGKTGVVRVTDIFGSVTTVGQQSYGIQAQSIAGGGGNGGFSVGARFTTEAGSLFTSSIGGAGGSGQDANLVVVDNHATISTGGNDGLGIGSHGILAQSIGGGGGSGGFSGEIGVSVKAGGLISSGIGGDGDGGGDGNDVIVTSSGAILTQAANSVGILAQSVGGGGGAGGFSLGIGGSVEAGSQTSSAGGKGRAAGNGGIVEVDLLANITTKQDLSFGILAQSVGGGGGNGGFSIGLGGSLKANSSVNSIGGEGGVAGDGGLVMVNVGSDANRGVNIHTFGEDAIGVLAQSIGGGGGNSGFSAGLSIAPGGKAENSVGSKPILGGQGGGNGGNGGDVHVNNWGTIITEGNNAAGILAQSVGGGGGNAGFSIAASLAKTDGASNSVGGGGASGGNGGFVGVANFGSINTGGNFSHGILAQSVGGGGGNGGFSITGTLSSGTQKVESLTGGGSGGSGGGSGGGGGNGGEVVVNNVGTINATGQNSFGIFAQSVGGGGGSGGFAGGLALGGGHLAAVVGGAGGGGGNGDNVTVVSTGDIFTTGDNSSAVFAQSVGGGGGWGGFSIGLGAANQGIGASGLTLGLGGEWGFFNPVANNGLRGTVTVTVNGQRTVTEGNLSYALLAQAIAAGGGAIGTVWRGVLTFLGSDVNIQVGSNGSVNGDATLQSSTYHNDATTIGLGSIGLISQSIGGGGGVTGVTGDTLVLNPLGNDKFSIAVGGFSGAPGFDGGGSGGGFDLTAKGTVTTTNDNAIGVLAQTIGGGGGVGNVTINTVTNSADSLSVTIGGSQTLQGDAGPASMVTAEKQITTNGVLSHGLVAQSIGGGGGASSIVFQNGVTISNGATVVLGSGSGGGDGGDVMATALGGVETHGNGAFGIVAQSIGGGGGLVGLASNDNTFGQDSFTLNQISSSPVTVSAIADAHGSGGSVSVISNGDVRTSGFGAHGIVAQSVGGGGGIVGTGRFSSSLGTSAFAGSVGGTGSSGSVSIATSKNVIANDEDSIGIYGGSSSAFTSGVVTIDVSNSGNGVGLIWGGFGKGAAIVFEGGNENNALNSDGTIYASGNVPSSSGLPLINGLAIAGTAGGEKITNLPYAFPLPPVPPSPSGYGADYGVVFDISNIGTRTSNVIGNVDLGSGNNNFINDSGALFITEAFAKLDNDGSPLPLGQQTLTNHGLLSPGDRGRVQVTSLSGNFVQTDGGRYFIDVDLNQQNTGNPVADRLNITGSADIAGEGPILLLSINKKFEEYVIVDAPNPGATILDNGFTPTLVTPVVGFGFNTRVDPSGGGEALILYADTPSFGDLFGNLDLGNRDPNVLRTGEGIDRIEQAIGADDEFNYLINLLRLSPDAKTLGDALVSLTPSNAPHLFEITHVRGSNFLEDTVECPFAWEGSFHRTKDNCLWAHGTYGQYERDSVHNSPLNDDDWRAVTVGGQAAAGRNWQVGFGFEAVNVGSTQTRDRALLSDLDANLYQLSLSTNYMLGRLQIGYVAAGVQSDWDSRRRVSIDGFSQTFTSFDGIAELIETPIFSGKEVRFEGISGIAKSSTDLTGFNQLLRLSYLQKVGQSFGVIPFVDIEGYILHSETRRERGVGLANLVYPSVTESTVTFTPGMELDYIQPLGAQFALRAYIRAGVALAPDNNWTADTQFIAAPKGLPPIKIKESFDETVFKPGAGLTLFNSKGLELNVDYNGTFGDTMMENAVRGGGIIKF
jgi:hypothetical protein